MDAPQAREQVQPIVEQLRLAVNDPHLDIQWEPKAVLVSRGGFDAVGKMVDPVYRGLWEIRRYGDPSQTAGWRDWRRVCFITAPEEHKGMKMMYADGPYTPVAEWVVDFMRQCDAANVERIKDVQRTLGLIDLELEKDQENATVDEDTQVLDEIFFDSTYSGGSGQYKGRGADFAAVGPTPETPVTRIILET
jgi:hypothetical protein